MDGAEGSSRARAAGGGERKRARSTSAAPGEEEALRAVCAAYDGVDGYRIAREEKGRQRSSGLFIEGLQYGEVDAAAFAYALTWVAPRDGDAATKRARPDPSKERASAAGKAATTAAPGEAATTAPGRHFIDLGSGVGKAVLTAAATGGFASATGVELLRPLHEAALAARARCDPAALRGTAVHFECGDALTYAWGSLDVVFVSLTCFTDEQVARVAEGAANLSAGARLLVTSRPLHTPALRLLRREKIAYGKGTLTFIAYERV